MNTLDFSISESSYSNDHQVRVIVDGKDWLGDEFLGIDPPQLFHDLAAFSDGELLIGRCDCGCIGCGDLFVDVHHGVDVTEWRSGSGDVVRFDRGYYRARVEALVSDHSWEPLNRTVERLLDEMFAGRSINEGHVFQFSFTRGDEGLVKLFFTNGTEQRFLEFGWDGQTIESALKQAMIVMRTEM